MDSRGLGISLTGVFWVADGEGALADLILKQVLLVKEEDDGGLNEPLVVANGVKELHALVHPVLMKTSGVIIPTVAAS